MSAWKHQEGRDYGQAQHWAGRHPGNTLWKGPSAP